MKIFWSWQSDTPGRVGRHFVHDALKSAIETLKQEPAIEEPSTRESRDTLHLDQDRSAVPGSPDLAKIILDKKIGKADIVGRKTRQIAVDLPEELERVHVISTDDAYGIERYWHRRFAAQRRGGESFDLSAADVKAFKRRKFM